jgi:hypothetical protein
MKIDIKIDELNVNSIVETIMERDEDGAVVGRTGVTLGDAIIERLASEIKKGQGWHDGILNRIKTIRDEEIRVAVRDELQAALTTPLQATNSFGERTGAPTTLREMIFKEAQKALGTTGSRYDSDKSMIEKILAVEIPKALAAEVKPILDKAKADIRVVAEKITRDLLAEVTLKVSGK